MFARFCTVSVLAAFLAGCATTSNSIPTRAGTEAPPGQDLKVAAYNVALGAAAGGIGALLNGEASSPVRRLARGAGWGAVGGSVSYLGKWQAGEVAQNGALAYALPARLLHDAGVSVIENAAHDRPPFSRFATHLGVVRLDVRPASGDVQARLLPFNALVFGLLLADRDVDLDIGGSLAYGSPFFTGEGRETAPIFGGASNGRAILGSVFVNRQDDEFHDTAAHELVHILQFGEMARIESALRAPLDDGLQRSAAYRTLSRWVYLDSPALMYLIYFVAEGGDIDAPCKYNNWIEREAEAFGSRRPVGVCP